MAMTEKLMYLPYLLPAFIIAAVLHELAHAVVAHLLGDKTPQSEGRLTLNPLKHLDPFGSAAFLFTYMFTPFIFGWAKPVHVYHRNFRNPKRDMALVALAGPLANFLIAATTYALLVHVVVPATSNETVAVVGSLIVTVNITLSVFNLLPIPPLDGSRIIGIFMPQRMYEDWGKLDQYAPLIFIMIFMVFQGPIASIVGDGNAAMLTVIRSVIGG